MSIPDVRIAFDHFDMADLRVGLGLTKAVNALAFAIQEQAGMNVQENESIDTGSLRNSIYVETSDANEREEVLARAMEAGKTVGQHSGEVGSPQAATPGDPVSEHQARVASCVEHGAYVEYGVTGAGRGHTTTIAGKPFLSPAASEVGEKAQAVASRFVADELGGK